VEEGKCEKKRCKYGRWRKVNVKKEAAAGN
jgi:hypothetical protein